MAARDRAERAHTCAHTRAHAPGTLAVTAASRRPAEAVTSSVPGLGDLLRPLTASLLLAGQPECFGANPPPGPDFAAARCSFLTNLAAKHP